MRLKPSDEGLDVDFHHEYLHRDQITMEEILEEGYSEDDDYSWEGQMPKAWKVVFDELVRHTQTVQEKPEEEFLESYLYLEVEEGSFASGYPTNLADWQYHMEELIQGIYEMSGRESPFYLAIIDQNQQQKVEVQATFATRTMEVTHQGSPQRRSWDLLIRLLQSLENMSLPMDGKNGAPKKGQWVTFGDDVYYKIKASDLQTLTELVLK